MSRAYPIISSLSQQRVRGRNGRWLDNTPQWFWPFTVSRRRPAQQEHTIRDLVRHRVKGTPLPPLPFRHRIVRIEVPDA